MENPNSTPKVCMPNLSLNLNIRGMNPSATVAINEHSDELLAQGKKIFKLGLGQSPFPVPDCVVKELKKNAHQKDYLPVKGLIPLRETLAQRYSEKFGTEVTKDDILVGPGSKELMFILQLAFYGDIIIPTPSWVSYAPQARIIGRQIQFLGTSQKNNWKMTAKQLETLCEFDPTRPRIIILNYPSNPTGATFTPKELKAIADVARRYKVLILSDEIYGRIHHDGKHQSILPYYPEGTIYSGGLSKWCGAGGWRLGFFIFPSCMRHLTDAMATVASETFTSTSAPIQHAAIAAFKPNDELSRYIADVRRVLKTLGKDIALRLRKAGAKVNNPEGGFYLFPDFGKYRRALARKGIKSSAQLCSAILDETGVAVLPGSEFGRPANELTMRLAYVNFDGAKALKKASNIPKGRAIKSKDLSRSCADTYEAIERLSGFFENL
jgi:aspartate aminotransferase